MTIVKWIGGVIAALLMLVGGYVSYTVASNGWKAMTFAHQLRNLGEPQVIEAIKFAHAARMEAAKKHAPPKPPAPVEGQP